MSSNLRLHQLNDVKLVGRLTRDPELRYTAGGQPVCRFHIAVSRNYKDKNTSEWKEEVAFVPVVVWRAVAERCGERLKKGHPVYVEGKLRSRNWETKEGQKRTDIEVEGWRVQFLLKDVQTPDSPSEAGSVAPEDNVVPAGKPASSEPAEAASGVEEESSEEVPF